jgi:eukaryotic-like serine/threonine-protein kinase
VNQVTAQGIEPDKEVEEGTAIRINVSKGPRPLEVPGVLGVSFEQASATLEAAGFKVSRQDVDSTQPADVVVGQDPGAGETAARGSTVVLQVSTGPSTIPVPDVTSQDEESAKGQLKDAGFKAKVERSDTDDPCLDGFVTDQDPVGGTEAEPGSDVTIFVGKYEGDQICG